MFTYTTLGPMVSSDPAAAAAALKKLLDPPLENGEGGQGLTCGQAGEKLGVGARTVTRWVRLLRDKGFTFALKEGRRPGKQGPRKPAKKRAKSKKRRAREKVIAN